MARADFDGNVEIRGQLNVLGATSFPNGTITNALVNASAGIEATKLEHQHTLSHQLFAPATSVAAVTKTIFTVTGATGTIVSMAAWISVVADDASRTIAVDLQKSTGGGSFSTVCSATADFTNGSTVRVPVAATLNSTALIEDDLLQVVVTVAGGSGNQATGLHVTVVVREDAV